MPARRAPDDYSDSEHAETVGWKRLMGWLGKGRNTVADLAKLVGVSQPTAHAWRWRHKMPTGEHLEKLCAVIGGKPADWLRPVRARRKAA